MDVHASSMAQIIMPVLSVADSVTLIFMHYPTMRENLWSHLFCFKALPNGY